MKHYLLLLALAGCSAAGLDADSTRSGGKSSTDVNDSSPTGTSDNDTGSDEVAPAWSAIQGSLVLVDGLPDLEASSLRTVFYADPPGDPLCSSEWVFNAVADVTPPDGEPLVSWWSFTGVAPAASSTCTTAAPLAEGVTLGFGGYDVRLDPEMAARGWLDATPYGLYVDRPDGEGIWLVGVAGTADELEGRSAPVEVAPLPDGAYQVDALVLSPISR
jgi:hypothetical protein